MSANELTNVARFPAVKIRLRRSRRCTNGCFTRSSTNTNAVSETAATANSPRMDADPQPQRAPCCNPRIAVSSPRASSTMPATSNRTPFFAPGRPPNIERARTRTRIATGTLLHHTHRQLMASVKMPPIKGPTAKATPPTAPQIPSTRPCFSLGKASCRIAMVAGIRIAAPMPWSARADELERGPRARDHDRGHHVEDDPDHEDAFAPEDVPELPTEHDERGDREQVGVQRPGEGRRGEREVVGDGADRGVDGGRVHRDQEQGEARGDERAPRMGRRHERRRRLELLFGPGAVVDAGVCPDRLLHRDESNASPGEPAGTGMSSEWSRLFAGWCILGGWTRALRTWIT